MVNRREFVVLPLLAFAASVVTGRVAAAPSHIQGRATSISVKKSGAVGDGKANDSAAIQAAIDEAVRLGGGDVVLPQGVYLASGLRLYSNVRMVGEGRDKTIVRETTGVTYLVSVNPGNAGSPDPSQNHHDIELTGIAFEGPVASMGFSEHRHLLNFNGVTRLWIHDCAIRGFRGDGVFLGSSNVAGVERHNISVKISKNDFDGINCDNRNGISVIDGTGVQIENNRFMRCSRRDMPGPIDIEPDGPVFLQIEDISIEGNRFDDCGGAVAKITVTIGVPTGLKHAVRNLRITQNVIAPDQRSGNGIYINVFPFGNSNEAASRVSASSVHVTGNQIEHGYSYIRGTSNFEITHNRFIGRNSTLILGATEPDKGSYVSRGTVADNSFEGQIRKNGALTVGRAELVAIRNNRFVAAEPGTSDPAVVFVQGRDGPMCKSITLSKNIFSDAYEMHIVSRAPATSDQITLQESNRTFSGRRVVTAGFSQR